MPDAAPGRPAGLVALTGASGLLGTRLYPAFARAGYRVLPLVRRAPRAGEAAWDPLHGTLDLGGLAGVTAAVHLAGESIAAGRWTEQVKHRIRESRTRGTRLLAESLARLTPRPSVLVSASAIGIYGDRGDEILTEESPLGHDFLAATGREWEAATAPAFDTGIRVVRLRFGIVLAREGGALPRMVRPFRFGVGGPIGSGRQWMSWVAIEDLVAVVLQALTDTRMDGPINVVAAEPVRNADFARALGRVLHRPALLPAPAFALRFLFGEMADTALLASQRVLPARLSALGFRHQFPTLAPALRHALDR